MTTTDYPTVYMPSTGRPAPPLLTKEQLAELLHVNAKKIDRTLYTLRHNHPNILRGVQVGHRVHFDLRDVPTLIDAIKEQNPR